MKGEIKIEIKFKKKSSNDFTTELSINSVTILHIASAVASLMGVLEKNASGDDKEIIMEILNRNAKSVGVGISIVPQGNA